MNKNKVRLKYDVHSKESAAQFAAAAPEHRTHLRLSMAYHNADNIQMVLQVVLDRYGKMRNLTLEMYLDTKQEEYGGFKYNLSCWKRIFETRIVEHLVFNAVPLTFRMIYNNVPMTHSVRTLSVNGVSLHHVPGTTATRSYFENRVIRNLRSLSLMECGLHDTDLLLILKTTTYTIQWQSETMEKTVTHRAYLETLDVRNNYLTGNVLTPLLDYALLRMKDPAKLPFTALLHGNAVMEVNADSASIVAMADILRQYHSQLCIDFTNSEVEHESTEASEDDIDTAIAVKKDDEWDDVNMDEDVDIRKRYDSAIDDPIEKRGKRGKEAHEDALLEAQLDAQEQTTADDASAKPDVQESSDASYGDDDEPDVAPTPPPAKRLRVSENDVTQTEKDIKMYLTIAPLSSSYGKVKEYMEREPAPMKGEKPLPPESAFAKRDSAPFLNFLLKAKKESAQRMCKECNQMVSERDREDHMASHSQRKMNVNLLKKK